MDPQYNNKIVFIYAELISGNIILNQSAALEQCCATWGVLTLFY